jgi:hypothetical protein
MEDAASGGLADEGNSDIQIDSEVEFGVAIDRIQHIRPSKRLQPTAGLPKFHTMGGLQDCLLDRLHRDASEVSTILDGQAVRPSLEQIRGQPQPSDMRVSVQTADELEDPLHRRPNDALPFDPDHRKTICGVTTDAAAVKRKS